MHSRQDVSLSLNMTARLGVTASNKLTVFLNKKACHSDPLASGEESYSAG
jgi:hypothetical protein